MMKYMSNHPTEFSAPRLAFLVGFLQVFTGFMTELCCMTFLGSLDNAIAVIIRFIALGSIAKVDNFYADALPEVSSFKQPIPKERAAKFKQTICFRDYRSDAPMHKKDHISKYGHSTYDPKFWFYKLARMFYVAVVFYFMPYFTIVLPYFSDQGSK